MNPDQPENVPPNNELSLTGSDTPPGTSVGEAPTPIRWWIFFLACSSSGLLYLHRYSWGVVKPFVAAENPEMTNAELGWLDSAFGFTYSFGQIPGGALGDLFGPRAVLSIFILSWSLCVAGLVLAHGFWMYFLVRSLFGLSQAGTYPVLSKVTRNWFPFRIRTGIQGGVTASGRVGGAFSSLILATVLIGGFGCSWETALIILAVPGLLLALAVWTIFRDSASEHPWTNQAERQLIEQDDLQVDPGSKPRLDLSPGNKISLGFMLLYGFCSTFADQLFVYWIPLFLKDGKGIDTKSMGFLAMVPLLGGALGGLIGGSLNDVMFRWTGRRRLSRSSVAFTGKLVAGVLILLSLRISDGRTIIAMFFVARFFNDWSLPTLWGAITDVGGRAAGTVFGLVNMVGACAMFVAGPIIGNILDKYDWNGVFITVGIAYLTAGACWFFIDCTRKLIVEEPAREADENAS